MSELRIANGEIYIDEQKLELNYPKEQYENDEALIDHYTKLLMENAGCNNCTKAILLNFMDEIIDRMN